MCPHRSHLFSILFLPYLNFLVPELTSILSWDPERCETFACSGATTSKFSFGGVPLVQCQCVGVWERVTYLFFVFWKPRRILYVFNICLTLVMEELHHHITNRKRIGFNIPQAVLYSLMLLKMGEIDARNMSSWFGFINKPLLLQLIGFVLYLRNVYLKTHIIHYQHSLHIAYPD